jgi:hypothetical protein
MGCRKAVAGVGSRYFSAACPSAIIAHPGLRLQRRYVRGTFGESSVARRNKLCRSALRLQNRAPWEATQRQRPGRRALFALRARLFHVPHLPRRLPRRVFTITRPGGRRRLGMADATLQLADEIQHGRAGLFVRLRYQESSQMGDLRVQFRDSCHHRNSRKGLALLLIVQVFKGFLSESNIPCAGFTFVMTCA